MTVSQWVDTAMNIYLVLRLIEPDSEGHLHYKGVKPY